VHVVFVVVHVRLPGLLVTVYFPSLSPPADLGGVHVTTADVPMTRARADAGAPGPANSRAGAEPADAGLAPTTL